jgi:hypothetical protein
MAVLDFRVADVSAEARLVEETRAGDEPRVGDVRVAGSTVPVATGRLFLPRYTRFQQKFIKASDGRSKA